jgi:hypothetical protein
LGGDERIAKLHKTHYDKKRVKNLLKVSGKLNEMPAENSTNNFITEVPHQQSTLSSSPQRPTAVTVTNSIQQDDKIFQMMNQKQQKKALHVMSKYTRPINS